MSMPNTKSKTPLFLLSSSSCQVLSPSPVEFQFDLVNQSSSVTLPAMPDEVQTLREIGCRLDLDSSCPAVYQVSLYQLNPVAVCVERTFEIPVLVFENVVLVSVALLPWPDQSCLQTVVPCDPVMPWTCSRILVDFHQVAN